MPRARLGLSETRVGGALGEMGSRSPLSFGDLVKQAGGTKAAAAQLGVTQRTVQRYLKGERGEDGQTRGKNVLKARAEVLRDKLQAPKATVRDAIKEAGGVSVHWEGEIQVSDDISERELDEWVPYDELEPMLDEWEAGNERGAAEALQTAFLNRYDENGAGGLPRDAEGNVAAFLVRTSGFSMDL